MVASSSKKFPWKKILPKNLYPPARQVRRYYRHLVCQVRWRRFSLLGVPILFANSFPKSGTHLLTQVLQGFVHLGPAVDSGLPAIITFDGSTGKMRSNQNILQEIHHLSPGEIAYGHLHAKPEIVNVLTSPSFITFFILRDPRDVVVSHVHYITRNKLDHILHYYYSNELNNFNDRLKTSILGYPDSGFEFPDIGQRFLPFMEWLNQPEILCLHYEEFLQSRDHTLGKVYDHALEHGFPIQVDRAIAIQKLTASIDPRRSPTFRSGKMGEWRDQFTDDHKRLFKEVAGEILIHLGYEKDYDW